MTDTPPDPSPDPAEESPDALRARISRLERRYERERAARVEAEQIAEAGLRDLWSANRQLEERVAERTAELEATLAATMVAASAKERFLGELGHELNTPLHNVLGLLELIEPSRLTDEDRRRVEEVRRHAAELAGLLHGLVELANADGAPMPSDITTEVPSAWLDDVVDTWKRPAAGAAQLLLPHVDAPTGLVQCDWRRLRRAADASLANVVTHADAGSVDLALSVGSSTVTLTLTDAGPGIEEELLGTLTEPFVSAGSTAGVGVGLAIAERTLHAAGGSLTVEVVDGCTRIRLELPAEPAEAVSGPNAAG